MDTVPPEVCQGNTLLPNVPGVYLITCTANRKFYVGSTNCLTKRRRGHFSDLRRNKHNNPQLQNAWNKYGEQAFTFEVLELVLIPEMLINREQYWLDKLKPFGNKGFNVDRFAGGTRLGAKATPETREKLRQSHLGQTSHMKGKKLSPEAREKARRANLGKKRSQIAIEKTRQANTGKKRAFKANAYRIEGDAAYIALAGELETIIDISDLEHVLKVRWYAQYHKKTDTYQARGILLDSKSIHLNRYLTDAKEGERVNHLNGNTLDDRRANLRIAQITDTYHNRRSVPSKLGIRGVAVDKQKVTGSLAYQFRCRGCKISKNFPYTEEGLEAARGFSEAHYAAMNT